MVKSKDISLEFPSGGFAGMTNRAGKKPIIVACNGHAHGKTCVVNRTREMLTAQVVALRSS